VKRCRIWCKTWNHETGEMSEVEIKEFYHIDSMKTWINLQNNRPGIYVSVIKMEEFEEEWYCEG